MKLTLNDRPVDFTPGETVLQAAKRAGIEIPHLCSLEWAPSPSASCRMCVVEVEGQARLATSCTLPATEGLKVRTHTPRLLAVRRNVMELLLASHPDDCLMCVRNGDCELAQLAGELGVRERRYPGVKKSHALDVSSPSLVRDPNKCILCGRCVTMCHSVQGVGAIDFSGRGFRTRVDPGPHAGLNVSDCIYCGQCARVCPTAALTEKSHVEKVLEALADPGAIVVAQVAPAVPATLMSPDEGGSVRAVLERLAAALKRIGFAAVYDTGFAADLTVLEEAQELVDRVQHGGVLPMFTSCSPAWVRWVETQRPELIPHLSTCKSPQQMAGALIKDLLPRRGETRGRRVVCVSIMPCTAKKYEADEMGDVDLVLTTRELSRLLARFGVDLATITDHAALDAPFSETSGAGRLFAGTGGVMEAAIRTAHQLLTGEELQRGPRVDEARGLEGIKVFSLPVAGTELRFAVVNGIGRLRPILDRMQQGGAPELHFIEVMSCPGGCVGGGGQPYDTDLDTVHERLKRLYEADRRARRRTSHTNEQLQDLLHGLPGGIHDEARHHLLHRRYVDRTQPAGG